MKFKSMEECFVQYLIELNLDFRKRHLEKGPNEEMIF